MEVRAINRMITLYRLERSLKKRISIQILQRKVVDLIVNFNYQTFDHLTSCAVDYELCSSANPYSLVFSQSFVGRKLFLAVLLIIFCKA
jgi:hypothetical protein